MTPEQRCRWEPEAGHLLRTHLRECKTSGCTGCAPCAERHCGVCNREHVTVDGRGTDQTCARCIGRVRADLESAYYRRFEALDEAIVRGINSEAANLAGPAPTTPDAIEAHRWRQLSAMWGRLNGKDHPELQAEDDLHPDWVLGFWALTAVDHLKLPRPGRLRAGKALAILDTNLTTLAHDPEFPFDDLARAARQCRAHLEDVLHDSRKPTEGAPCPMCGEAKLQLWHADCACEAATCSGVCAEYDTWWCPRCRAEYAPADYRERVDQLYPYVADRLTAKQIAEVYRVPERTVRHWGAKGRIQRRGLDAQGRTLYAVADVLALRDTLSVKP